jgi:ATP-dependent Lhr-like helicase
LVVLVDGEMVWYLERGGRSLLTFSTDPDAHQAAGGALAHLVGSGRMAGILVEKIDGASALEAAHTGTAEALIASGFSRTPRGLRIR